MLSSILEKIFLGAIGGLVAYLISNRKFVKQRWWDKRFELYSDVFDVSKQIEQSLAIIGSILSIDGPSDTDTEIKEAARQFEEGLSRLHGLQNKLLIVGLDDVQNKILPLYAALSMVNPYCVFSENNEERKENYKLIKQSKGIVGGFSGEIALQGRYDLQIKSRYFAKLMRFLRVNKSFFKNFGNQKNG